jgi:short-subunit dehydrogenase
VTRPVTCKRWAHKLQPRRPNLADHQGTHKLIHEIQATGLPVDAVAINAGVGVSGRFVETDLDDEMNMVRLNVMSVLHLLKYMVKDMVARGRGRILITSSIAGTMPTPYQAVYGATKAFERSLAQSLREELKDTGVTITALMPGATETNFFRRADAEDTPLGASEKDDPADVARQGFEALMAGKDHVIAGSLKNKFQAGSRIRTPRSAGRESARCPVGPRHGEQKVTGLQAALIICVEAAVA